MSTVDTLDNLPLTVTALRRGKPVALPLGATWLSDNTAVGVPVVDPGGASATFVTALSGHANVTVSVILPDGSAVVSQPFPVDVSDPVPDSLVVTAGTAVAKS